MESIYRALIESIHYISERDVPDDIADDDVSALESIIAKLRSADERELNKFIQFIRTFRNAEDDPISKRELDNLIENLEP